MMAQVAVVTQAVAAVLALSQKRLAFAPWAPLRLRPTIDAGPGCHGAIVHPVAHPAQRDIAQQARGVGRQIVAVAAETWTPGRALNRAAEDGRIRHHAEGCG